MRKEEKELFDEKIKNIHQSIDNGFEKVHTALENIIEHNEYQNGKIASTIEKVDKNTKHRERQESNPIQKQIDNRPAFLIIIGVILLLIILGIV